MNPRPLIYSLNSSEIKHDFCDQIETFSRSVHVEFIVYRSYSSILQVTLDFQAFYEYTLHLSLHVMALRGKEGEIGHMLSSFCQRVNVRILLSCKVNFSIMPDAS